MNLVRFNVTDKIGSTRYKRGYKGVTIKGWTRHAVGSATTRSMGLIPRSQWCSRTTSNCPCTTTDTSFRRRLSRNARSLRQCPPRGVSPRGGCRGGGLPAPRLGPCDYHVESERYFKIQKYSRKKKKDTFHYLRQRRREDLCRGYPHTRKPTHQYIVSRVS